jgi:hypothetical protein
MKLLHFFLLKYKVFYEHFAKTNINSAILKYEKNLNFLKIFIILNIFLIIYDWSVK